MTIKTSDIRKSFLDFFKQNNHSILPSSSLIPHNDPTLMFVNSGMVQFKNIFTGKEKTSYKSVTTSQKCVRAGGKHNDLENVGFTTRHHSFFEMLGNFSFNDYFKEYAIKYAWEFLTKELGINKDKLIITIYHNDDEAFNFWKKIATLPDEKIIRINSKDNFWSMGDTGPCGPCSEIFYDHGESIKGGLPGSPEQDDGERFVEIWNLVFMQFEQLPDGSMIELPGKFIDTGMGLERIASVMQGVGDNFAIDLFRDLIEASEQKSGIFIGNNNQRKFAHRIIADHLRSSSFLIADGIMPSNEGRGYVLRRIIRRAIRYVKLLGYNDILLYRLVDDLIKSMGKHYPELIRAKDLIESILKSEEEKFGLTLEKGLILLEDEIRNIGTSKILSGDVAFKLYDTYGFPIDLTSDILKEKQISIDTEGFNKSMNEQKEKAKQHWVGSKEKASDEIWFNIENKFGQTEFLGYQEISNLEAKVIAIIKDGKECDVASGGDGSVDIIFDKTTFYGESGGQIGDVGKIFNDSNIIVDVTDTKKYLGNIISHKAVIKNGEVKIGDNLILSPNYLRRKKIAANHSATHLLHSALREILGNHVTQKGSLVEENFLRFDFSHMNKVTDEQIEFIEKKVNFYIRQNTHVKTEVTSLDDAKNKGVMALFGEKYDDLVRVLNMGIDESSNNYFSKELCGGIHVENTGDIGLFKITSEASIASGIRRIEAMTGEKALEYCLENEKIVKIIADKLKNPSSEIINRLDDLLENSKKQQKIIAELNKQLVISSLDNNKEDIAGINIICKLVDNLSGKELSDIANYITKLKSYSSNYIIVLSSIFEGKVSMTISVSENLTPKIKATDLMKISIDHIGGKGFGGKDNFAQAGGTNADGVTKAFEEIKKHFN